MVAAVKLALRLTNSAFDDEVNGLIAAARADLRRAGVTADDTDALVRQAVVWYAKAHFGYDNPDAERLQAAYDLLKLDLASTASYTKKP